VVHTEVVLAGVGFPEGPRWRDGRLWFSDMQDKRVRTFDPTTGATTVVAEVAGTPSGLGWDAGGRLLVVSMLDRRLLRLQGNMLVEVADLSGSSGGPCNDMVVDAFGRAYVGNIGFDLFAGAPPRPTGLALVDIDGSVRVVAPDLWCPNGAVLTADGGTLIVAETLRYRLTAFSVAPNGSLHDRRIWADLEDRKPDGITIDAEGACWVAVVGSPDVIRVLEGGRVVERVTATQPATACAIDDGGRALYICTAPGSSRENVGRQAGRIERADLNR
jgi:sugar lactone lactonase YvrE